MNALFQKLIDVAALPGSETDIGNRLSQLLETSVFAYYAYLQPTGQTIDYISNLPRDWCDLYMRRKYTNADPAINNARRNGMIKNWSLDTNASAMSRASRKMYADIARIGIRSGVTIPISTGFGRHAIFSLYCRSASPPDLKKIDPVLASVSVAHLHVALARSTASLERPKLKARETRCLRWIAEGKSLAAVADLEGVSYSGARFLLQNAKTALGAVSLPQATAAAKELRLI